MRRNCEFKIEILKSDFPVKKECYFILGKFLVAGFQPNAQQSVIIKN
jgi:hypothetical protein